MMPAVIRPSTITSDDAVYSARVSIPRCRIVPASINDAWVISSSYVVPAVPSIKNSTSSIQEVCPWPSACTRACSLRARIHQRQPARARARTRGA